jgi:rhodanese-related sulfurtransferase
LYNRRVGISRAELSALVASGQRPVVFDVRSAWEFARGRVPGARHLPFWTPGWPPLTASMPADTAIVVYCGYGPRAWWAAMRLPGFTQVHCPRHMQGWRRAGLGEERS